MNRRFAMLDGLRRGQRWTNRRDADPIAAGHVESWSRAGCHCDPCSATADPSMFFASAASRKIQSALLNGIETGSGCMFLITGEAGIGKTMQLHALEAVLRVAGVPVMVHDGAAESSSWVGRVASPSRDKHGARIVDLVDAAEHCSSQTIALLTQALRTADTRGFHARLVIAARPEIEARVHGLVAAALGARIPFNWLRLDRVDAADIEGFVTHRLRRSGFSSMSPLSAPALRRIIDRSAGLPRRILGQAAIELDAAWRHAVLVGGSAVRAPSPHGTTRRGARAGALPLVAASAWLLMPTEMVHRAERYAIETIAAQPRLSEFASPSIAATSDASVVEMHAPSLPLRGAEDAHGSVIAVDDARPAADEAVTPIVHPVSEPAPDDGTGAAIAAVQSTRELSPALIVQESALPLRRALDAEQIASLTRRGDELLREGDIAAARLFFDRAAAAGDASAMRALAITYDPLALRRLGVVGLRADPLRAQYWRHRAEEAEHAMPRVR